MSADLIKYIKNRFPDEVCQYDNVPDIYECTRSYLKANNFLAVDKVKTRAIFLAILFFIIFMCMNVVGYIKIVGSNIKDDFKFDNIFTHIQQAKQHIKTHLEGGYEISEHGFVLSQQDIVNYHLKPKSNTGYRRDIIDRNGYRLATSLQKPSLYLNTKEYLNKDNNLNINDTANKLVYVFNDLDKDKLIKRIKSGKYILVKRKISPSEVQMLYDLGIPGIDFQNEYHRIYPFDDLFPHLVGYAGADGKGFSGIELGLDEQIRQDGEPIKLAVDVRLQKITKDALIKSIDKFEAKSGIAAIMDAKTGEMLSYVNYPDFDPNIKLDQELANDKFFQVWEHGSTMKAIAAAMALDIDENYLYKTYDATNEFKVQGFKIGDYFGQKRPLTFSEVFIHSSNIGTSKIAMDIGKDKQIEYLKKFGFMEPIDTEIRKSDMPSYPSLKNWQDISSATISYGYGLSTSPLHIMRAYSSFANDGKMVEPKFLKQKQGDTITYKQVIKPEVAAKIRGILRLVVKYGSGKNADVDGFYVGGKTGTANQLTKQGYVDENVVSSFVSMFPIYEPKYLIFVSLQGPKGQPESNGHATGGWTSAPVAKEIIEKSAPILNLPIEKITKDDDISYKNKQSMISFIKSMPTVLE